MHRIALLIAFVLVATPSVALSATAERDTLNGFQDFLFGMNEAEIRSLTEIESVTLVGGGTRLLAVEPVPIDGTNYKISFLMGNGELYSLTLGDEHKVNAGVNCGASFDRVFALLQLRYGTPDQVPKEESITFWTSWYVTFTFLDGAAIRLRSNYINNFPGDDCSIAVNYRAGNLGSGSNSF